MAYTFGAATGDDVNAVLSLSAPADNRVSVCCGWFRPTTLTAGRYLWSHGANSGVRIASTTDEVVGVCDRTTDSVRTTTGVDLVVGEWTFLAAMYNAENTGPADRWRVWRGTVDTPPTEVTVTDTTTGSGNVSASATWVVGNNNTTGTVAFQGDVDNLRLLVVSQAQGATTHPLMHVTSGTITQAEADFVLERLIRPAWLGEPWEHRLTTVATWEMSHWPGTVLGVVRRLPYFQATPEPHVVPTYNGATPAATRAPRPMICHPFFSSRHSL